MDYMKPFGCNCQNKVSQDECSRRGERGMERRNEGCMERERERRGECAMERGREQRGEGCMERVREQRGESCMERERRGGCSTEREPRQESSNRCERMDPLQDMPLAMAYVPWQTWRNVYDASNGLRKGTIFGDLILPFLFASPVCRDSGCGCGRRGDMR